MVCVVNFWCLTYLLKFERCKGSERMITVGQADSLGFG